MRYALLLLILCWPSSSSADILHLRDGSRHYGEVVREDAAGVRFRVTSAGGASVVRDFPADVIARVERSGRCDVPPSDLPATTRPVVDAQADRRPQMLREAFELLDDRELAAALRAMQRAVRDAGEATLAELDAQCREARGVPLGQLLAQTRLYLASRIGHGRGFYLKGVTKFERPALVRSLAQHVDTLLQRERGGRRMTEWAARPAEYTEVLPDARCLVADASRAAALITARLRLDVTLKQDRAAMARWTGLRGELVRLANAIVSLPGYTDLSPDDGWVDPIEPPVPMAVGANPSSRPSTDANATDDAAAPAENSEE
jgi:hypothetical protein